MFESKHDVYGAKVNARHEYNIARVLTEKKAKDDSLWVDHWSNVWRVHPYHSGFILNAENSNAHIPYWTSYKIYLPSLREFKGTTMPEPESLGANSADFIIKSTDMYKNPPIQTGNRYRDNKGIVWRLNIVDDPEIGYEFSVVYDNGWLPERTMKRIIIPGLRFLATEAQMMARKAEFDL